MILAIDTSQMTYSIALSNGESHAWDDIQISLYDKLQDWDLHSVTMLIINIGPGRFSGLRSGLAFAKGFARGKNIPVIAINNFDLIASKITDTDFQIALDARKDQVYFRDGMENIQLLDQSELKAYSNIYGNITGTIIKTSAEDLIRYYEIYKPEPTTLGELAPIYIRDSV